MRLFKKRLEESIMANKGFLHKRLYTCLGEVISIRRRWLRMSQTELADESGVDRAFISNLENGKRNPSFGTVARIAQGLKTSLGRLVTKCEDCCKRKSA